MSSWAAVATLLQLSLLLSTHVLQESFAELCNATSSSRLDALLSLYDREVMPTAPVLAEVGLDVRHASIDDKSSTMHVLADLRLSWRDDRLAWNESEWGCDSTLLSAERIWLPDIALVTAGTHLEVEPLRASVGSAGDVVWFSRLDIIVPVALDIYYWPDDQQTVTFDFASRTHAVDEIDLKMSQYQTAITFETGVWKVQLVSGDRDVRDGARVAMYEVQVRRSGAAASRARRCVLVATAAVLLAAVAVPPQQRLTLAAAAAFTATLWLSSAVGRVPAGPGAPLCVSVMCGVAICAAVMAAGAALATRLAALTATPPQALRSLLAVAAKVVALCSQDGPCAESGTWAAAARLLDMVLLAALTSALLVLLGIGLWL